jgi:hypothetical protein
MIYAPWLFQSEQGEKYQCKFLHNMMMSAGERLIVVSFGILTAEGLPEVVAGVKVKHGLKR